MAQAGFPDENLRSALREMAAEAAPEVIEQARRRATARAQQLIEDLLVQELLSAAAQPAAAAPAAAAQPQAPVSPVAEASAEDAGEAPTGELWWTYCVLREADAQRAAEDLEGIESHTLVEVVCDGELAALISPVPRAEYGDERLRAHLEDLAWVERAARRHEDVLEAALAQATIVPLRLCTLFRDREGVRRLLREHCEALVQGLTRVDGCVEWGVKVFSDPRAPTGGDPPAPEGAKGRGATYLLRRQHERALAEKAGEVRARCVEVIHQRVAALARACTANPPQRPEIHGREQSMLLNGAYLVERGRTPELQSVVQGLEEEWAPLGFAIELTGPWPPYNFVSGAAGVMS